jgi:hypothetical protein
MATTYEQIATYTTSGSSTATISFTGIAASWTNLRISMSGVTASSGGMPMLRFNTDTGANYNLSEFIGSGSTVTGYGWQTTANPYIGGYGAWSLTNSSTALIDIFDYAGSKYKHSLTSSAQVYSTAYVIGSCIVWRNTAAITSIQLTMLSGNYANGVIASLYGIKAA